MDSKKKILIPMPSYGFDPTEISIPWKYLAKAGHKVTFSTPTGKPGVADAKVLKGVDFLSIWKPFLMADQQTIQAYSQMEQSTEFQNPIKYSDIDASQYDALLLPGGHDKGVKEFLESDILHKIISQYFKENKPVGAICHGCLAVGRSTNPETGKSVLYGRKTSALTRRQEMMAYGITRMFLGDYYLTYPETTVEDEMKTYLEKPEDFQHGHGWPIPLRKDTEENPHGFAFRDGNYVSARWAGDANKFAKDFLALVEEIQKPPNEFICP